MSNQSKEDYSTPLSGSIKTGYFYQLVTLTSRTVLVFAVLLVGLLSTSFWFQWNAEYLGGLAIIIGLIVTHGFLIAAESDLVSRLFSFVRKGKPLVVYRRWLRIEEQTLVYGVYRLLWTAIDSVSVSHFGNLIFKSRALCGSPVLVNSKDINPANKVLKIPFAAVDVETQKRFIALLKTKCPQANIASTLEAIMGKPIIRSANYIHIFTGIVFLLLLFDAGYSSFRYVELLKRYYLADQAALLGNVEKAEIEYKVAEQFRLDALPFSMVSKQLFTRGTSLAAIQEARSRVLWDLGQKEKSLLIQENAARLMPKSYKVVLREARLYSASGKLGEARNAIESLIDKHKHALLPRMYLAFLLYQHGKAKEAKLAFKEYLAMLDKEYFSLPPVWPPSGEESLHELFYRDDLRFLFPDTFLSLQSNDYQTDKESARLLVK
jgi:tetratricopeptide (TPR) repeat protein